MSIVGYSAMLEDVILADISKGYKSLPERVILEKWEDKLDVNKYFLILKFPLDLDLNYESYEPPFDSVKWLKRIDGIELHEMYSRIKLAQIV